MRGDCKVGMPSPFLQSYSFPPLHPPHPAPPSPALDSPQLWLKEEKVEMGSALSDLLWNDWPRLGSGRGREGTRLPKSNQGRTVT